MRRRCRPERAGSRGFCSAPTRRTLSGSGFRWRPGLRAVFRCPFPPGVWPSPLPAFRWSPGLRARLPPSVPARFRSSFRPAAATAGTHIARRHRRFAPASLSDRRQGWGCAPALRESVARSARPALSASIPAGSDGPPRSRADADRRLREIFPAQKWADGD